MAKASLLSPTRKTDAKALTDLVSDAEGYKDDAETAAGVATTQANAATTQANAATASASEAEGYKDSSLTNAQAAAAAAASIGDVSARVMQILKERGITNIKAIAFKGAEGWEKKGAQSYKTEDRPAGRWLGDYANATAAWAANKDGVPSVADDVYWNTTLDQAHKLTTSDNSEQIFRYGSDDMPAEAEFVISGSTTSARLLVFNLTDPEVPFWMEFKATSNAMFAGTSASSEAEYFDLIFADGVLHIGRSKSGGGAGGAGCSYQAIDFIKDTSFIINSTTGTVAFPAGIKQRNSNLPSKTISTTSNRKIADNKVYALDAFDGYVSLATFAGLSVAKPDKTTVSSASSGEIKDVKFLNGRLYALRDTSPEKVWDLGNVVDLSDSFSPLSEFDNSSVPPLTFSSMLGLGVAKDSLIFTSVAGFDQFWPNPADSQSSLIARHGLNYATLPMKKPELMLICSTVQGSYADTELMTNGTFDADINGWVEGDIFGATTVSWDGAGAASIVRSASPTNTSGFYSPGVPVTAGKLYRLSGNVTRVSGTVSGSFGFRADAPANPATTTTLAAQSLNTGSDTECEVFYRATFTGTIYAGLYTFSTACEAKLDNVSVKEVVEDFSGKDNHATINGTLTATALTVGGVAGLSGFDSADDTLTFQNPLSSVTTEEFFICGAFKTTPSSDAQILFEASHYESEAYVDTIIQCFLHGTSGYMRFRVSTDGLSSFVSVESASTYDDDLLHTWTARKKDGKYELHVDEELVASLSVGLHGTLSFDSNSEGRIGGSGSALTFAQDSTIFLTSASVATLYDNEVSLIHKHMRNLIEGKASLDEIPTSAAYDPIRQAVELVGTTYRQTLQDGAITSSVEHGQGSNPVVAVGPRSEIGIGGSISVETSVPERNLREKVLTKTIRRFKKVYEGDATGGRSLFPDPTNEAEIAETIGARPVGVTDDGSALTEGESDDYEVVDYGLGRYCAEIAVDPADGNDVVVEFEIEEYV